MALCGIGHPGGGKGGAEISRVQQPLRRIARPSEPRRFSYAALSRKPLNYLWARCWSRGNSSRCDGGCGKAGNE